MIGQTTDKKRDVLLLLALVVGGAIPIQLISLSFGYAQYYKQVSIGPLVIRTAHEFAVYYTWLVYVPGLVVLFLIALYCRRHYPDIFRRIVIGLGMGAIATIALDAVRQAGVIHGWLPGDTPVMFGKMVTGSNDFRLLYPVGLFVHYANGASFGLFYAFVWGKRNSYLSAAKWAIFWLLLMELGMMTLPPMGPMVGLFGVNFQWPHLFLLTLLAHILCGLTLGLLVQHFLHEEERGGLYDWIIGKYTKTRPS